MSKSLQLIIRVWLQKCINDEVDYGSHEADVDFDKHVDGIEQAILDWHNKQVIAELEELLGQQDHEGHLVEPTSNSIRDRINKLKERQSYDR